MAEAGRPRWGLLAAAILAGSGLLGFLLLRGVLHRTRDLLGGSTGSVSHSLVVERVREVAKLVTTETTVRDVVIYRNRRLGSTKQALVVVTGKVQAGIDLGPATKVEIDPRAHRIGIALPAASVLGVEIVEMKTYDERSGLWNPFRAGDRDTIFHLAREQLLEAAGEMDLIPRAERSAETLLRSLFAREGYTVEVTFDGRRAAPPPGDSSARMEDQGGR
jgi:hypothetical protein